MQREGSVEEVPSVRSVCDFIIRSVQIPYVAFGQRLAT